MSARPCCSVRRYRLCRGYSTSRTSSIQGQPSVLYAGIVGNLIDRIRNGLVIDFIDFRVWPVFNIADIAIVLGVASMIYAILYKMKDTED